MHRLLCGFKDREISPSMADTHRPHLVVLGDYVCPPRGANKCKDPEAGNCKRTCSGKKDRGPGQAQSIPREVVGGASGKQE